MAANYRIVENITGSLLVIRDIGPWDQFKTITNDAETVVKELAWLGHLPDGRRLLYYDSDGRLDEIFVREGKFAGFRSLVHS